MVFKHIDNLNIDDNSFKKAITNYYLKNGFVNINEVESNLINGRRWKKKNYTENEINIGFQIDQKYILRCMITLASIMDSQKSSTFIRFHFGVVLNFRVEDMIKIYSLRRIIRDDVEFNFYNASKVENDLEGLNSKGPGAVAKLLLPQLLSDDIDRLLIFDTGDLLVIKDLYEAYNWNITDYLYAGVPGRKIGQYAKISKKIWKVYISVGSFLINVKNVKKENMYEKFVMYKNEYNSSIGDQDLLNDVAYGKITFLPFKFGMQSPFNSDKEGEIAKKDNIFSVYFKVINSVNNYDFLPKSEEDFMKMGYSPSVIHHCYSKWMHGGGLTIHRRLAQYYIKYARIWDEVCRKYPGYCKI